MIDYSGQNGDWPRNELSYSDSDAGTRGICTCDNEKRYFHEADNKCHEEKVGGTVRRGKACEFNPEAGNPKTPDKCTLRNTT